MNLPEVHDTSEDDVVLDGAEYRAVCLFCGESAQDGRSFRTLSIGTGPDTVSFTGLAFLCPEHREADGVLTALLVQLAKIVTER